VVWRVRHRTLDRECALRLIRPEFARDERTLERLLREARRIARLRHPNIVTIYDVWRDGEAVGIEMELVHGRSLVEILDKTPDRLLPLGWVIEVMDQLCSALQAAHSYIDGVTGKLEPIIHGGLKPSDLLLVQDGGPPRLKVLDFGVAGMVFDGQSDEEVTSSGHHFGTPAYASPEQIKGEPLDARTDLYSTGVILYQLLTGSLPFRGSIRVDVLVAHLMAPPPSFREVKPALSVSPEIERVVMQCLEKDPSRRPRSARELAEELRRAVKQSAESTLKEALEAGSELRIEDFLGSHKSKRELPEAERPASAGPPQRTESAFRRWLKWFRRPPRPGPATEPTSDDLEARRKHGGEPEASELPARPPHSAAESPIGAVPAGPLPRPPGVGRKLYVGNLPYTFSSSDLERLFSQFGTVLSAEVMQDRETGRSKGFGFVEMSDEAESRAAMNALHDREYQGRRLTVAGPKPRESRADRGYGGGRSGGGYGGARGGGGYGGGRGGTGGYGGGRRRSDSGSDEPVPTPPSTIRRHTDVSFPAVVQLGKVYNLRVQLVPAEEMLRDMLLELPRPHPHDATLDLRLAPPARPGTPPPPVKLTISVAAENFEVEGPSRIEIVVPLEGKSPAVSFGLEGLEVGPGRIMVDFAQDGRPVGSVDLMPEVVADFAACRQPDRPAAPTGDLSLSLGIGPGPPAPDVVLKVFEHRMAGHPGRLQFVLSSNHPALADLPVLDGDLGTLDLKADVAGWVGEQLRAVGELAGLADGAVDAAARTMTAVGYNLFQQVLPPAVQELSWTLRQRGVKTLLVLSDEPYIPWEMIKPFRADPASGAVLCEDGFWAESYAMARWLRGRPPVPRLAIGRVFGVAAGSSGPAPSPVPRPEGSTPESHPNPARNMVRIDALASVAEPPTRPRGSEVGSLGFETTGDLAAGDEELALLRSLEALGARVERLPALRGAVRQAFEEGSFDLLHLVSHGTFDELAVGDASAVYLDDGAFTAAELSPLMAEALRRATPLVIFNTCHCGRIGYSLTRLGSWGAHLVRLGCGAFVSALWPVSDRAALAFARAFYEQLARKCPLGEAVRLARLHVREQYPGDPTWLAYCCFADPMAQVEARAMPGSAHGGP
jgi:serine/threonine protein kinase